MSQCSNDVVCELRGIRTSYGEDTVLRGVDLEVRTREIVAVTGTSGCGKSTLLNAIAGLVEPTDGEVHLVGHPMHRLDDDARALVRRRELGIVFQFGDLLDELTLVDNVALPLRLLGTTRTDARQRAVELLDRLGVAAQAGSHPREVSGGQAQRAAVARAVIHGPRLVLADEPTGALGEEHRDQVFALLNEVVREAGAAMVLVTHDLALAETADLRVVLRSGVIEGSSVVVGG